MTRMMERLDERLAHQGGRADGAFEARALHHLDDGGNAASLLADESRPGVLVLDLRRGVGAIAELVLEPLQADAVARPVGEPARHEEAGEPAFGIGESEEGIRHRRRAEPFMAVETIFGAWPAQSQRRGAGG